MSERIKILLIRLSAIGDVVNVLPAAHLIRQAFPNAHITFAVEKSASSLLYGLPELDDIFVIDRRTWARRIINPVFAPLVLLQILHSFIMLRKKRFDLCFDFQGNFRSGVICFASGSKVRIGFTPRNLREFTSCFYTRSVRLPRIKLTRAKKNLLLVQDVINIPVYKKEQLLHFSEAEKANIDKFFISQKLTDKKVVIVHPGSSKFGSFKKWSEDGYAKVCSELRLQNIIPLLSYGPGEKDIVQRINKLSGSSCSLAPELNNLKELAYLISKCSLFIGADTGPMHIAAIVGTPIVAIFGPKDPDVYKPYCSNYLIVRKDLPCSPCERRKCSHLSCLKSIAPENVLSAVKKLFP
ncbi:MAG: glycosyltransferase family 9 protein [Planctomycetota bacterium]